MDKSLKFVNRLMGEEEVSLGMLVIRSDGRACSVSAKELIRPLEEVGAYDIEIVPVSEDHDDIIRSFKIDKSTGKFDLYELKKWAKDFVADEIADILDGRPYEDIRKDNIPFEAVWLNGKFYPFVLQLLPELAKPGDYRVRKIIIYKMKI